MYEQICVWMRVWVINSFFFLFFRIFQVFWSVVTPCEGEFWHPSVGNQVFIKKQRLLVNSKYIIHVRQSKKNLVVRLVTCNWMVIFKILLKVFRTYQFDKFHTFMAQRLLIFLLLNHFYLPSRLWLLRRSKNMGS